MVSGSPHKSYGEATLVSGIVLQLIFGRIILHLSNLHKKVFTEPWHAQLFATTHAMAQAGHFEWKDWANHFSIALKTSKSLQTSEGDAAYYEIWLKAFEEFLIIAVDITKTKIKKNISNLFIIFLIYFLLQLNI